jgi:hypothetical protein
MNLLSALPVILILETIGSNLIVMKLHGYTRFSPLMPALNAMHAPVWLYVYYLFVAFVFYYCLKALSMHTEDWSGALLLGNARNTATRALFVQERGLDGDGANGDESQESEGGELAVCGATAARGEKQGRVAGRQGFEPR